MDWRRSSALDAARSARLRVDALDPDIALRASIGTPSFTDCAGAQAPHRAGGANATKQRYPTPLSTIAVLAQRLRTVLEPEHYTNCYILKLTVIKSLRCEGPCGCNTSGYAAGN